MILMSSSKRLLLCACVASTLSACTTFGTNVRGDFTCRAPQGDCAPSHVIDARATAELGQEASPDQLARVRVGVAPGDTGRTLERTLRIVFPAHVAGTAASLALVSWHDTAGLCRTGTQAPTLSLIFVIGAKPGASSCGRISSAGKYGRCQRK